MTTESTKAKRAPNFPLRMDNELRETVRLLAEERGQTQHEFIVRAVQAAVWPAPSFNIKDVPDGELLFELMRRKFQVTINVQMPAANVEGVTSHFEKLAAQPGEDDDGLADQEPDLPAPGK